MQNESMVKTNKEYWEAFAKHCNRPDRVAKPIELLPHHVQEITELANKIDELITRLNELEAKLNNPAKLWSES